MNVRDNSPRTAFPFKRIARFVVAGGGVALLVWLLFLLRTLPSFSELESFNPPFTTRIYSADSVLMGEYFTQRRVYVPLREISPYMSQAVIALEDRRFYKHWGLDLTRITKALWVDISHLSYKQGGSTITQQLAKNLFLTREKTISRKLREVFTAVQLERTYSKDEILEMYLTMSYFGHGAYGVQSAAKLYFGKKARELEVHEAALLAGLLRSPARYSPYNHPDRALRRRNLVIDLMAREGFLSPVEQEHARARDLDVRPRDKLVDTKAPYFVEYVRQQLEKMRDPGTNPELPHLNQDIYNNGLHIYTTLDYRLQTVAESLLTKRLEVQDSIARDYFLKRGYRDFFALRDPDLSPAVMDSLMDDTLFVDSLFQRYMLPQGALVALDPRNGAILSMVGGRDFASYKFNTAVQAVRQPGSLFKPFLYLCALEGGYPPTYRIPNRDVVVVEENGRRWTPRNWDGSRGGEVTLRYGLEHSLNLISVRLMMEAVPPARLVSRVRDLKITTPLAEDYTLALGSSGVIPLEIIAAYGIFANQGIYHRPRAIREIRDRNENLIFAFESPGEEVLSASSAFLITSLLQGVVDHGTASALRWRYHLTMPLAGKTGTTNQFTDAWFVGYTPQLVTGLWIGMDNPAFKLGRGQYGGKVALPVFAGFIKRAYELPEYTPQEFAVPANIEKKEVCDDSGGLATPLCPHTHEEYFLQGTAPLQSCSLHRPRGY